jgi:hypothetical protein
MSSWNTKVTSWLAQVSSPPSTTAAYIIATHCISETHWPHGVLSGGTLIDILESLSTTANVADSAYTQWLHTHYIEPFGLVDRLDGLVVQHADDSGILIGAYERYIEFLGSGSLARKQKLWVPGLEPVHGSINTMALPQRPGRFYQQPWRSIEASYKDGKKVEKKGIRLGPWKDEAKWERVIWTANVELEDGARQSTEKS